MSMLPDFEGLSCDGEGLVDPRGAFFKIFCIEFNFQKIAVPEHVDQSYLTKTERISWNPHNWFPPPDLEWIRKEMAHQNHGSTSRRMDYLQKCFQVTKKAAQGLDLEDHADEKGGTNKKPAGSAAQDLLRGPVEYATKQAQVARNTTVREKVEDNGDVEGRNIGWSQTNEKQIAHKLGENENSNDMLSVPSTASCQSCAMPDTDEMISCSSKDHQTDPLPRWFHYGCVGLTSSTLPDQASDWYCVDCVASDPIEGEDNETGRKEINDDKYPDPDDSDDLDFCPSAEKQVQIPKHSGVRRKRPAITSRLRTTKESDDERTSPKLKPNHDSPSRLHLQPFLSLNQKIKGMFEFGLMRKRLTFRR